MNNLIRLKYGVLAISLLLTLVTWTPFSQAKTISAPQATTNESDLNRDGLIDRQDLIIFAIRYLETDIDAVDWCAFSRATLGENEIYGRKPSFYLKHFRDLLSYINRTICELSDLNDDYLVNTRDLMIFSEKFSGEHFLRVDWCVFLQNVLDGNPHFGNPADYYLEYYGELVLLIQDKYTCTDEPPPLDALTLTNQPKSLVRIAASRNTTGDYYVTDARVGSVFIYDSNLVLTQELKGLATPLGIAVNSSGHILVGNNKRNNVEVYNPDSGELLSTFGESELEMPVSVNIDDSDNVYVTDSRSNTIYVYDSSYQLINQISEPGKENHQIRSPADSVLSADQSSLFVADRLNQRIKKFDMEGNFLGAFLPEKCGWFGCSAGTVTFTRIQAMDTGNDGKIYVLDIWDTQIAVINPDTGSFLSRYGANGQLKSPMDLLVETDRTLVVDGYTNKIEVLSTP